MGHRCGGRTLVQNRLALLAQNRIGENCAGYLNFLVGVAGLGFRLGVKIVGRRRHNGVRARLIVVHAGGHHAVRRLVSGGGLGRGIGFRLAVPQGRGRRIHLEGRQIELRLSVGLLQILFVDDQRRGAAGVVLGLLQIPNDFGQVVHHLTAGFLHLGDAALQVLQPQAVGVLYLPRFIGGRLHHLARLGNGLFPGQLVDGLGFQVRVLDDLVSVILGLLTDAGSLGLGIGDDLVAVGQHLLAGLVMGAALDPQGGVCLLALLGQFLIFPHKVAVFQP